MSRNRRRNDESSHTLKKRIKEFANSKSAKISKKRNNKRQLTSLLDKTVAQKMLKKSLFWTKCLPACEETEF